MRWGLRALMLLLLSLWPDALSEPTSQPRASETCAPPPQTVICAYCPLTDWPTPTPEQGRRQAQFCLDAAEDWLARTPKEDGTGPDAADHVRRAASHLQLVGEGERAIAIEDAWTQRLLEAGMHDNALRAALDADLRWLALRGEQDTEILARLEAHATLARALGEDQEIAFRARIVDLARARSGPNSPQLAAALEDHADALARAGHASIAADLRAEAAQIRAAEVGAP